MGQKLLYAKQGKSRAKMKEIACKLKKAQNTSKVIGFAVTGSLNDFEVISEV